MFGAGDDDKNFRLLTIVTDGDEDERIVHVPVPAQAGYASEMMDPSFISELPTFSLPDYRYKSGTHRSFDVSGDSMEPTLFEGDKVICSFLEPNLWESSIKDSHVYVVVTRGDVVVKRLENLSTDQALLLRSDNTYYEPYKMMLEDIQEIWYVRAKISPFLPAPAEASPDNIGEELRMLQNKINDQTLMIKELKHTLTDLGAKA